MHFIGNSLDKVKAELVEIKAEILRDMSDTILDQNDDNSLAALMSAFDLSSEECLDGRLEKVSAIYDIYGVDSDHMMEDW